MAQIYKIMIDPGHGGTDPGATGNGLREKDLTLRISEKIRTLLLQYENADVRMTRNSDQSLTLKQRSDMANSWNADFLLSVHINAGGGRGYEDYRHPNQSINSASGRIQSAIHTAIMSGLQSFGVNDRGIKSANFHMLRETNMPAILTENLFIDNVNDARLLNNENVLDAMAQGHASGIASHFNLTLRQQKPPVWDNMILYNGQIGRITILRPINLWTDDTEGNLRMVRILQPNERYRVYGYRTKHGGQYDVGAGHWITNMEGYIRYETPSRAMLERARNYYM